MKDLGLGEAVAAVAGGAAFIDLQPANRYLEVHIPRSIPLVYEFGPGLPSRARDCLPLDLPLILIDDGHADVSHAAASLRGKGFAVIGYMADGVSRWSERFGHPASTDVVTEVPTGTVVLDVGDPGTSPPEEAVRIPVEQLWLRTSELDGNKVAVVGGAGVRAALALGILERAGYRDLLFLKTRR